MLRRWWIDFQAWRGWRHYLRELKRRKNRPIKKQPRPYRYQGWEFDKWEVK